MTLSGTLTAIYSFPWSCAQIPCTAPDGALPDASLVQATNGDFYGTAEFGSSRNCSPYGCGTVFKMAPAGELTTLYSFCVQSGCPDGSILQAGLVQATDGNFYGTTEFGGNDNCASAYSGSGTVFKITPAGKLTTLYSFCTQSGCPDGYTPGGALFQATNGALYGTTTYGGAYDTCTTQLPPGCGTIFSLSVGLGPFVETQTTSGKVGAAVNILETNLIGATSVSFNGKAAIFKVVSGSEITTTVPAGATTGTVKVATPSGTLSSNLPFRVT
jgi:uncharacterized repeat protein (TIGR03803 family)